MDQVRITIMLNSKLSQKLRRMQSKKVAKSSHAISFSSVLNEVLAASLKVKLD